MPATFAEWLKAEREARSLSQDDLATAALGVNASARVAQSRISEWERGKSLPTVRQLEALLEALKLRKKDRAQAERLWKAGRLGQSHPSSSADEPSPTS